MDPQRPEAQRLKMMLVDATTWRNDQERYVDSLREMLRRRTVDLSRATGLRFAANKRGDKLEAVRYQYHAAQAAYAKESEPDSVNNASMMLRGTWRRGGFRRPRRTYGFDSVEVA